MTLQRWIDSRPGAAPPALAAPMRAVISAVDANHEATVDEAALHAALMLAAQVLCEDSGSRSGAMTLLAADALVTYAFEAAAESPGGLEALAEAAMVRIAASVERAQ